MVSFSSAHNSLPLFLLWLLCISLFYLAASGDNPYTFIDCPTDSNFTLNSTYQSNLNHVLSTLPSAGSPTGFTVTTHGDAPDQVFGRAICRGDESPSQCQSCLDTASQGITDRCPLGKRAIIFYDKCFLRYSDSNSTTPEEKIWMCILYNVGIKSDVQAFIVDLAAKAATSSRKFETGQASFASDVTMYGLAQCMRDLSVEDCRTCLNQSIGAFKSCCNEQQGGVVLRYECYLRMETYPYFVSTSTEGSSPPPLSPALSPPPQSVNGSSLVPSSEETAGKILNEEYMST